MEASQAAYEAILRILHLSSNSNSVVVGYMKLDNNAIKKSSIMLYKEALYKSDAKATMQT